MTKTSVHTYTACNLANVINGLDSQPITMWSIQGKVTCDASRSQTVKTNDD